MSLQHLHYILTELDQTAAFVHLDNCDFYKRCVTRIIALRTDDFIKLGFSVNRINLNDQKIKDELNALKVFYEDHLKLQRDKFGAHFQYLDLAVRLETWSALDLMRADFFSSQPNDIYQLFSTVPGYLLPDINTLSVNDSARIELVNTQFDIEKYPNISSDILALTRQNSGGLIHFSPLQHKAGVLKSLELLIDYEIAVLDALEESPALRQLFLKLFIVDLVSYADNLYTRTDILPTAPQYELGLDGYVANDTIHFPEAHRILTAFKANFKFQEGIDELRPIRNQVAGHIDPSIPVNLIQQALDLFDLERFHSFYGQLKDTFKKICLSDLLLQTFAIDPSDRLHGVSRMESLPIKTFDGTPAKVIAIEFPDVNNEDEYERYLQNWLNSQDEDSRSYFYSCSLSSIVIEHVSKEVEHVNGETSWVNYDIRKIHQYFERKLQDNSLAIDQKLKLLNLLIKLSGTSYALNYILVDNYPTDRHLQKGYITAMGYILNKPLKTAYTAIVKLYAIGNFYEQYECLMALYRIDMEFRRSIYGKHLQGDTTFSVFLKAKLKSKRQAWIELVYALALASEYVYGRQHMGDTFKKFYFQVFEEHVLDKLSKVTGPLIKNEKDKRRVAAIRSAFYYRRYALMLCNLAEFLEKKKHKKIANNLFAVLYERLVFFAGRDASEISNYALACFKRSDLKQAIKLAKNLTHDYAYNADHYLFLLTLYLQDKQYKTEFDYDKGYVLNNFNLTQKLRTKLLALSYED